MRGASIKASSIAQRSRRPLMCTSALVAATTAFGHAAADAQVVVPPGGPSYLGSGAAELVNGSPGATITNGTTDISTRIRVNAPNAVINWTPTDNATRAQGAANTINFQDQGVTTFVGPSGYSTYTVLNRIVPADTGRSITFNGSTKSYLADGGTPGGNIWFYSPGGIILGANAKFDVGSLLLSTAFIGSETGYGRAVLDPGQQGVVCRSRHRRRRHDARA